MNGTLVVADARVGGFFAPGGGFFDVEASVNARAGYLLGDRVLLYGTAGIGHVFCCSFNYWNAGGGAEIALGDRLSLFGEARAFWPLGGMGPDSALMVRGGLNFHL